MPEAETENRPPHPFLPNPRHPRFLQHGFVFPKIAYIAITSCQFALNACQWAMSYQPICSWHSRRPNTTSPDAENAEPANVRTNGNRICFSMHVSPLCAPCLIWSFSRDYQLKFRDCRCQTFGRSQPYIGLAFSHQIRMYVTAATWGSLPTMAAFINIIPSSDAVGDR